MTSAVCAWSRTMFWNSPSGKLCAPEGFGEALAHQQGLRGVLEDDAVACHQRRNDRVDGGQVGIVPRRDDQHGAERLALDQAPETSLRARIDRLQRFGSDGDHVARALLEAAQFTGAVAHRPAHLPCQFRHDFVAHRQHRIDRVAAECGAFGQRAPLPLRLRLGGCAQGMVDLCRAGAASFNVDQSIDRGNAVGSVCSCDSQ